MHTDETEGDGVQQAKHDEQQHPTPLPTTSTSSSPSHEFSFTISQLHPSSASKNSTPPPFAAVDLSPADEIFFHGHLLPLHLLSHFPASPRSSSSNSMDSFTLPAIELFSSSENNDDIQTAPAGERSLLVGGKAAAKSKSFSLFFGMPKRRNERETAEGQKRKSSKFDHVSRFVAKYARMMRPLVTALRNRRENCSDVENRHCNSFSGNLKLRSRFKGCRDRKEFSAPASTRNSPTNSGLLISTEKYNNNNSSDHSTMEELQAAIQSAIAHCKNSVDHAGEDKNKKLP